MKRRKALVGILSSMLVLSACSFSNTNEYDTEVVSDNEVSTESTSEERNDESTAEITQNEDEIVEIDTTKIIEDQSFDIQLNEWGDVRFVSCQPDKDTNPHADATFYLMDQNQVIYKMPSVYENDIRDNLFEGISFVAFKDINEDEKDEVIIGLLYITGAGPQGVIPRTEVRIFEDKGDSFEYSKDISEYITDSMPEDGTIHDVYDKIKWYKLYAIDMASLYKDIKKVDNAENFEGRWEATNCHSSLSGDFIITNQTEEGFSFEGCFSYYSHTGDIAGNAHFVSPTIAICSQDDLEDSMSDGYMIFLFEDNLMYVRSDYGLGLMGMNVSPTNAYTRGEPVYTNADMLGRTYTEDELSQIKQLLGESLYNEPFLFGTINGGVTSSWRMMEDGRRCKYVECYIPTMAENYKAVITEDGKIYIKIYTYGDEVLYTNDSDWDGDELPEVF